MASKAPFSLAIFWTRANSAGVSVLHVMWLENYLTNDSTHHNSNFMEILVCSHPILIYWLQQNFTHDMTAKLLWNAQNFVAIWWPGTELQPNEISNKFELWVNKLYSEIETGLLTTDGNYQCHSHSDFRLLNSLRPSDVCVSKLTITDSKNGLSPGQCQAIIWTNAGILLIWPLGTNFREILIKIHTFSLKKCIWNCHLRNGSHFVSASMC